MVADMSRKATATSMMEIGNGIMDRCQPLIVPMLMIEILLFLTSTIEICFQVAAGIERGLHSVIAMSSMDLTSLTGNTYQTGVMCLALVHTVAMPKITARIWA